MMQNNKNNKKNQYKSEEPMGYISYTALKNDVEHRNEQITLLFEEILNPLAKWMTNIFAMYAIYKTNRFLVNLNKLEKYCVICEKEGCGVLSLIDGLTDLRDIIQETIKSKEDFIKHSLILQMEELVEELDNKLENYHIGSDKEIVDLISLVSAKYSQ